MRHCSYKFYTLTTHYNVHDDDDGDDDDAKLIFVIIRLRHRNLYTNVWLDQIESAM